MSFSEKWFNSKSDPRSDIDKKQKLNRRSTKAMSDHFNHIDDLQFTEDFLQSPEPPSPVSSSDEGSSVQVKYLSYLTQVIDSAPEGDDSSEIQFYYHNAEYWHVIYQAAIYVRKDIYRTDIDDYLLMSEFQEYLKPGRIHPEYSNQIGQLLLRNGYFLCAFAISLARKRKSAFIFRYLMQHFQKEYILQTNQEEFSYLLENYVYTDKAEEILHLNLNATPFEDQNNHFSSQQTSTPQNHQTPRNNRRLKPNQISYQQYVLDQGSERSRTIIIDDNSQLSIIR